MAPQSRPLPVLLTRPSDRGDRFAADLAARFGDAVMPVSSPLMVPVFLAPDWPDEPYSSLILTSETGVEAAARLRDAGRAMPARAICVGDRTAAAAEAAGFAATSANGDAEALIALVLAGAEEGPFLHLRGRDARGDIAPRLTAKGRPAHAAIVYAQDPLPLTPEARAILSGDAPVIVPLFSPRSVDILAAQGPFAAPLLIAAISPAAAARAEALRPARLETATRPDAAAMMEALALLIPQTHA